MLDRRQSARNKVIYGGVAEVGVGERGETKECVVRNISEKGARLEFSNVTKLPGEQMLLTIARKGRSFLAKIIWWRDNFVGRCVQFGDTIGARLRPCGAVAPE